MIRQMLPTRCVLLFSGGRDSTIAAVRLASLNVKIVLVTVTTKHLVNIQSVRNRLYELKRVLPADTRWIHATVNDAAFTGAGHSRTCLPCQAFYAAIGTAVARSINCRTIAFGYTEYQSSWIEQTPTGQAVLRKILESLNFDLLLPVQDILSKEAAFDELQRHNLSTDSLEQKCFNQQLSVPLSETEFNSELNAWEALLTQITNLPPNQTFGFNEDILLSALPEN
jgi:hypothetical protein